MKRILPLGRSSFDLGAWRALVGVVCKAAWAMLWLVLDQAHL